MQQPFSFVFSEKHFKIGTVDLKTYMKAINVHCDRLTLPQEDEYYSQTFGCYGPSNQFLQLGIDRPPPSMASYHKISRVLLLHFVIGGKGTFNGIPFERGQFFYAKKLVPYSLVVDSEEPWFMVWLAVNHLQANKLTVTLDEISKNQFLPISDPDGLWRLVQFWMYEMPHTSVNFDFYDAMVNQVCSFLVPKTPPQLPTAQVSKRLLQTVHQSTQYIESNLATVTVSELAKQANFEHTYFTRIFTAVKGVSPKDYILNTKMEMAKHYLTVTDISIEEINFLLGYTHRNSLTALFKKKYGVSPQEYRTKNHHTHK